MLQKIKIEKEVDVTTAECQIFARYWEDSELNGVDDDAINPKMPCVKKVEHFYYGREKLAWCPTIDLDNGRILNWPLGDTATIHYKSCDENVIILKDNNGKIVKEYVGYVPDFLDSYGDSFGDYVIVSIDSEGYIREFNKTIEDMFEDN